MKWETSEFKKMRWETYDIKKRKKNTKKNIGNSGPTPVARGSSGAKAPLLAARAYWQVVNPSLLGLLNAVLKVYNSLELNYHIKSVCKIVPKALIVVLVWRL